MSKKIIDLDTFSKDLARDLTIGLFNDIDKAARIVGTEYTHDMTLQFISYFIGTAVYRVLRENRRGTKGEIQKRVQDDFRDFKHGMQEAVAFGFQAAMSNYSKINIDYYCKIVPEPEFKTKLPC